MEASDRLCLCGAVFTPSPHERIPRKWCSEACRVKHYRKAKGRWVRGETRSCAHCSSDFEPAQVRTIYCSPRCDQLGRAALRPRNPDWAEGRRTPRSVPCVICSTVIESKASRPMCDPCKVERQQRRGSGKNRRRRAALKGGDPITISALFERDGGRCHLCGGSDVLPPPYSNSDLDATIDHVVPVSAGGRHVWGNVRLAHRLCNSIRGAQAVADGWTRTITEGRAPQPV